MLSAAVENLANEPALFLFVAAPVLARRRHQRCFPITALAVPNFTVLCQCLNRCLYASMHVLFKQRRFTTPRSDQTDGFCTRTTQALCACAARNSSPDRSCATPTSTHRYICASSVAQMRYTNNN